MIDAFRSGKDIHAATAAQIYNFPIDKILSLILCIIVTDQISTGNFSIHQYNMSSIQFTNIQQITFN
jgi:hypothetical protein